MRHRSPQIQTLFSPSAPSSPTGCLWENTTWWRKRPAPKPSCPRRLLSTRNGTRSSWPLGETSATWRAKRRLGSSLHRAARRTLIHLMLCRQSGQRLKHHLFPYHLSADQNKKCMTTYTRVDHFNRMSVLKHAAGLVDLFHSMTF